MTSTRTVRTPLVSCALETERHVAAAGWDQPPRLFALVRTEDLYEREPHLRPAANRTDAAGTGTPGAAETGDSPSGIAPFSPRAEGLVVAAGIDGAEDAGAAGAAEAGQGAGPAEDAEYADGSEDAEALSADGSEDAEALSAVEQEGMPHTSSLESLLGRLGWPPEVDGVALAVERLVVPPEAERDLPQDPERAAEVLAADPRRKDVRLLVAVLRDGQSACLLRQRDHDSDDRVALGADIAPGLVHALMATLAD